MNAETEYFWRGAIKTKAKADKIITIAGSLFFVIGLFIAGSLIVNQQPMINVVVYSCFTVLPAIFLLVRKSIVSAAILFVMSLWASVAFIAWSIVLSFQDSGAQINTRDVLEMLVIEPMALVLTLLSWRSMRATVTLRALSRRMRESSAAEA